MLPSPMLLRRRKIPVKVKNKKEIPISELISKRRGSVMVAQGFRSLFFRVVFIALAGYLLFTQVFLITQAHGYDMFPSIRDGDLVIAFRVYDDYQKNDVIVCNIGGKQSVLRILARAGDVVTIGDQGNVQVNGTNQGGDIMYPTYARETGIEYPFRVPEGTVFVLGDYRTQTKDSRDVGPIPVEEIDAKVITILRRRGL